jgi:hypothetical protein
VERGSSDRGNDGELPVTTREAREKAAEERREREREAEEGRLSAITVAMWREEWVANERAARVRETRLERRGGDRSVARAPRWYGFVTDPEPPGPT